MEHFDQKEKELWANMPDDMKKWYNSRLSQMLSTQRFWPIIFTKPPNYKLKSEEDWLNKIWIWDSHDGKWQGKTSLKVEIKRFFIKYKYEKIIALTDYDELGTDSLIVYDFNCTIAYDCEVVAPKKYSSFFCSMYQEDIITCGNIYNQVIIQLKERTDYHHELTYEEGTKFLEIISIFNTNTIHIFTLKTKLSNRLKVHILVTNVAVRLSDQNHITLKTRILTEWTLPCELFPEVTVTTDENNMYISGMEPLALTALSKLA